MKRTSHLAFATILITYLALAIGYSFANPLYESTDELRHFRYVRHLIVYRDLPVQQRGAPRAQSHHPPLYYALGALSSWWVPVAQDVYYVPPINPHWDDQYWEVSNDNKNLYLHGDDERFPFYGVALAVYVVRWMTVLIGASVVWLTYRIGREAFSGCPTLAIGGTALLAFNPQFLYLSGSVNNDVPAALCGAAVLWACVRLVQDGPSMRADVTLGVLFGASLLTKFNLLALLVPIALAYLIAVWPTRDWLALLRGALVILGLTILISGWWFWRNQMLYGDFTGMGKVNELWSGQPAFENWWAFRQSLPYLWSSLWGRFGYGQLPLPSVIYRGLFILCVLALAGYLIPRREPLPTAALALMGITVLAFTVVVFYYILIQPAGAMGRFLFPSLPAFVFLILVGLNRLFPRRLTWVADLAVTIGMAAVAIYALVGVLTPAFARPHPLSESKIEAIPNSTSVEFGNVARLLGYRITPHAVEPGDAVEVTLYWETLARTNQEYTIFVHLLSDVGTMVAQRDTHPGLGRYPTTTWEPGIVFADTYRVHIPETAYTPDTASVQVGMYLTDGPRLITSDGQDSLRLAAVGIQPRPSEYPNPLNVNFGGKIALIGYELDRRMAQPGDTIRLTLYWKPLAPMEKNYSVFAQVLGSKDQVWARSDGWPVEGQSPTSHWELDDVVKDVRDLTIGLTTPPDFYDIEVGLYARGPGRLPAIAEDGHKLGARALLSKIRVVGDE
jgi:4-amino-4-deoxy-L-arabinose transferase-like glycosyltransferase